jgi:hypothetical protein
VGKSPRDDGGAGDLRGVGHGLLDELDIVEPNAIAVIEFSDYLFA